MHVGDVIFTNKCYNIYMRVKLDKADTMFSKYIRKRDGKCVRCGGTSSLQNSHYYGRGKESTRFDPENCDTLCFGCHQYWGSTDREEYREFKIKQLGEKKYEALKVRARTLCKKDRNASYLFAKELYDSLED